MKREQVKHRAVQKEKQGQGPKARNQLSMFKKQKEGPCGRNRASYEEGNRDTSVTWHGEWEYSEVTEMRSLW